MIYTLHIYEPNYGEDILKMKFCFLGEHTDRIYYRKKEEYYQKGKYI